VIAFLVLVVLVGWSASRRSRQRAGARAVAADRSRLPLLLDLVGVCIAGGLTPGAGFARVAPIGCPAGWWSDLARRLERGQALADALGAAGGPQDLWVRKALGPVAAAARSGGSVEDALDRTAQVLRGRVRREREERARRLPVALLLPLTMCVLPAVMLVVVAPLLARVIGGT
jgi:tight adherence protein C